MLSRRDIQRSDRGTSAILLAFSMVLLMGIAAVVIDATGAGFNERRQDQISADVAASAGGVEVLLGASGTGISADDMVTAALASARSNLSTQYDNAEWQQLWEECTDPNRNTEAGDNFVALDAPSGWNVVDPNNWCMSVDAAKSLFRVRVPDQLVPTSFGRVLGFTELSTKAAAVVNFDDEGGGVLPFGIPSGIADGVHHCLSEPPPGLSSDPCDTPDSGNFGVLKARIFGSSPYNGCNAAPSNPVLALNIAAGIDHTVLPFDTSAANEIRDECFNFPVNTLQTDPGFGQGVEDGLGTGAGLPAGETALLKQGPQPKQNVAGNNLDDRPLWNWLLPSSSGIYDGTAAPLTCNPAPINTWQQMGQCLKDYVDGSHSTVIFSTELGDRSTSNWSPRFGYAPQFHENSLGPGNTWRHIFRFRAIFIQGTWWKKGSNWKVHQPGEGCFDDVGAPTSCTGGGNHALKQVTSWIIPDEALPSELRGDPPGSAIGINPFVLRLIR